MKKKVLFICTHNSARSQIAEAYVNKLLSEVYEAHSAGTEPSNINLYVVKAMEEVGIDLSEARPKSIEEFRGKAFDYIVTVCDHAKEVCPFFPGEKVLHKSFEDPSEFEGSDEEVLEKVRKVRDEIKKWILKTFKH